MWSFSAKEKKIVDIKNFNFIINKLREIGHFTLIPKSGFLDQSFVMASIYTFLDKAKLNYDIKKTINETDESVVFCGIDLKQTEKVIQNENIKKIIFLPDHYLDENLCALLDERCEIFCCTSVSFDFIKEKNQKAKIYLADNIALDINLKDLKCSSKETDEIPLGKRYIIWHVVAPFISKIKRIKIGRNFYQISYFLKESSYPNAIDISKSYFGNFSYRPMTKWLCTLLLGIIKGPDIIVTNMFWIATIAAQLGKTVFILQDKLGQEIQKEGLKKSIHFFFLYPEQEIENNIQSVLQSITCIKSDNLRSFQKMNPIPEADLHYYGNKKQRKNDNI